MEWVKWQNINCVPPPSIFNKKKLIDKDISRMLVEKKIQFSFFSFIFHNRYNNNNGYNRPKPNNYENGYKNRSYGFNNGPDMMKKEQFNIGENLKNVKWTPENLLPFKKDFYQPSETAQKKSAEDVRDFFAQHEITCNGNNVPNPMDNFAEGLPDYILQEITNQGFEKPTAIQSQGFSIALSGRNLVSFFPIVWKRASINFVTRFFKNFYSAPHLSNPTKIHGSNQNQWPHLSYRDT